MAGHYPSVVWCVNDQALAAFGRGTVSLNVKSLTDQFTVLSEDRAVVDPEVWQGAARAINQRERLRLCYPRFDGVMRDYLLEPYHLAAYHGNWYLVAWNAAAERPETFALSRCRSLGGIGGCATDATALCNFTSRPAAARN